MSTFQRSSRAIWRASSGFLVAAVPPGPPTRMAGSAAAVWHGLSEPVSLDELVERLVVDAGAPAPQIRADVQSLLDALVPLGLVEVRP